MNGIYKSPEGERLILERYREFLTNWPVPFEQVAVPTREGDTGVIVCGAPAAPPLLLFHGSLSNSLIWMADVALWAPHFRVHAVDLIGEPGLSAQSRPDVNSDAYALWLDDLLAGLEIAEPAMVGISLGGWLALDYAIRRPGRVRQLVVMCPAGVGRQRRSFYFKVLLFLLLGKWGRTRLREQILGAPAGDPTEGLGRYMAYLSLVQQHVRPRIVRFELFSDAMLRSLGMPLLAIVGARDVFFDAREIKRRLEYCAPAARVVWHEDLGHMITEQGEEILRFLLAGQPAAAVTAKGSPR